MANRPPVSTALKRHIDAETAAIDEVRRAFAEVIPRDVNMNAIGRVAAICPTSVRRVLGAETHFSTKILARLANALGYRLKITLEPL